MEEFDIRPAIQADLPAIRVIIAAAQAFLRAQGVDQWQNGYPDDAALLRDIASGAGYIVEETHAVRAYFALSFAGEPTYDAIFDGAWRTSGAFGVVHRLAVSPDCRRGGVASRALGFCATAARARGVPALRVDTHERNRPMRGMLEKNGFRYCCVIYLANGDPRVGYEKLV